MRHDLKMPVGKLISQGAHASMKATLLNMEREEVKEWLAGKFTKIAVLVRSEEELLEVYDRAREAGLIAELVTDAGLTVFNGVPTNTCIAVGPATHEALVPITGHLKLL